MDQQGTSNPTDDQATPRALAIAERGIRTGADFANVMSALMSDVLANRIPADTANAACNAGGKLLKVVEMQYRHGARNGSAPATQLTLANPDT